VAMAVFGPAKYKAAVYAAPGRAERPEIRLMANFLNWTRDEALALRGSVNLGAQIWCSRPQSLVREKAALGLMQGGNRFSPRTKAGSLARVARRQTTGLTFRRSIPRARMS